MKVDIVSRRISDSKRIRELICGHTQEEPNGGKAHLAKRADCKLCEQKVVESDIFPITVEAPVCACTEVRTCDPCWKEKLDTLQVG